MFTKTKGLYNLLQSKQYMVFFDANYGGSFGKIFDAACPLKALHVLENNV